MFWKRTLRQLKEDKMHPKYVITNSLTKLTKLLEGIADKEDDEIDFHESYQAGMSALDIVEEMAQLLKNKALKFEEWNTVWSYCREFGDNDGCKQAIEEMYETCVRHGTKEQWRELAKKTDRSDWRHIKAVEVWEGLDDGTDKDEIHRQRCHR